MKLSNTYQVILHLRYRHLNHNIKQRPVALRSASSRKSLLTLSRSHILRNVVSDLDLLVRLIKCFRAGMWKAISYLSLSVNIISSFYALCHTSLRLISPCFSLKNNHYLFWYIGIHFRQPLQQYQLPLAI